MPEFLTDIIDFLQSNASTVEKMLPIIIVVLALAVIILILVVIIRSIIKRVRKSHRNDSQ